MGCGCVLCGVVRKNKKCREHWESKQDKTPLWARFVQPRSPKKVRKRPCFPDALLFLHVSLWILPTFSDVGSCSKRPKKALFHRMSYSKGPNHAFEKVLTNETLSMFFPLRDALHQILNCMFRDRASD